MPLITSLLPKLTSTYPDLFFQKASDFRWSPQEKTVYYSLETDTVSDIALLLHELSHGLLHHSDYHKDVELISMEREAWDKAITIAPLYDIVIDEDMIQSHLDTYRDWLHARSTCPDCQAVGHQIKKREYRCVACGSTWRVNEARLCGLKRYKL